LKELSETVRKLEAGKQNLITNYLIEGIYPSILLISQNGRRLFLDPRDPFITVHYLQNQTWEPQLTSIFEKVFLAHKSHQFGQDSRAVFIDCGANIGLHSMKAAEIGYEVFAFEPDPITFKLLELNGTINGLQIKSRKLAVSDVEGELEFTIDSLSSGMSGLSKNESGVGRFTGQDDPHRRFTHTIVESITLSKHFANETDESNAGLLCLKIDTEGAEGEVLEGATDLTQKFESYVVICEMHLDNIKLVEQYKKLIETELSAGKFVTMHLLKFMEEPIIINHREPSTWHQYGSGDLAIYVSKRDIFKAI
jgi:FkbM family methyltransferase